MHYKGHCQGTALKIETFWGPAMVTSEASQFFSLFDWRVELRPSEPEGNGRIDRVPTTAKSAVFLTHYFPVVRRSFHSLVLKLTKRQRRRFVWYFLTFQISSKYTMKKNEEKYINLLYKKMKDVPRLICHCLYKLNVLCGMKALK